jgi:hypothetical protein
LSFRQYLLEKFLTKIILSIVLRKRAGTKRGDFIGEILVWLLQSYNLVFQQLGIFFGIANPENNERCFEFPLLGYSSPCRGQSLGILIVLL